MADEQRLPDAKGVQRAQHRIGAIGEAARVAGQSPGIAVTGGIDGDDQKSHTGDPAEHPQIGPPTQQQPVHEQQRHSAAAD